MYDGHIPACVVVLARVNDAQLKRVLVCDDPITLLSIFQSSAMDALV
jgi:hypothetical protein